MASTSSRPAWTIRSDPRQYRLFQDEDADRRYLRARIDYLVREICGDDRARIIALNAQLKMHYHPNAPRSACNIALLRSIVVGLEAEALSIKGSKI